MTMLDDLRGRAHPLEAAAVGPTLRVDREEDVGAVFAVFAADEPPDAIRLVVDGEPVGELRHEDVLDLFPLRDKSYGASGGLILPGEATARAYRFLTLDCPVAGCPASPVMTPRFDPGDPPCCDVHPDRVLEQRA